MQQHNTNGLYRTRVTVWLANRQRAKCSSGTIVPGERKKERCAGSAKRDRTGDGKRRRTNNARRDGKPDGQTGASGEWRATKRENGTGGAETSGGWRATKRENGTGGAETTSEEAGRSMLTDHSNNSTKQASRNSRINLSHTLERRRRATARYTSTNHYGALTTASKH